MSLYTTCISSCAFQLEREKDEHLLPRLQKSPEPQVEIISEEINYNEPQVIPPSHMADQSESEESDQVIEIQENRQRRESYR